MRPGVRPGRGGAIVALLVVALTAPPAAARDADPWDRVRKLPSGAASASVKDLAPQTYDLAPQVHDLAPNVQAMERQTLEGAEQVVALNTDILFEFGKADLPAPAAAALAGTVRDVPQGAVVRVEGHTDSIGSEQDNQRLSEGRAAAVSAAIGRVRPDLTLQVAGFGESRPVAANESGGQDDPAGRALNRRVELRYTP